MFHLKDNWLTLFRKNYGRGKFLETMGNVFDRPTNFFPPVRLCAKNLNINHKSTSELPIAGLKITVSQ